MDAGNSLSVYRGFNQGVLKRLDAIIHDANQLLIDQGVIPDLGMDSARKHKPPARSGVPRHRDPDSTFGSAEEEEYTPPPEQPELFSMMQGLLHRDDHAAAAGPQAGGTTRTGQGQYAVPDGMVPAHPAGDGGSRPFVPARGQQVQMVDAGQLMEILSSIQQTLKQKGDAAPASGEEEADRPDIAESLGEMLQEGQEEGVVQAIDRQSSDVINLVTMLYEAIWDDDSVPIPIKELIGRTQITIIKVALSDTTFFNKENHPARMLLNEFAAAGIGWTEVEQLQEDPLYQKMQQLVNRMLDEYEGDNGIFEELLKDFKSFQAKEAAKNRRLEQRILKARERQERLEDIKELVTQKIGERILGRDLNPFITELLEGPFHKFMVMLVLKEGPGGNAWKQAMNTIDVLLWSVQAKEHHGDRDRLETVNPRLLNNLRKAFRIASLEQVDIDQLIMRLEEVQQESLETETPAADEPRDETAESSTESEHEIGEAAAEEEPAEEALLADDDREVQQVDAFTVGVWVEFTGEDEQSDVRCKLAAKINAIDKFIFVNRQGVKVVEKTRMGLARELKDGTVKIVSDGLLFSRALETVIGNLREAQHEQQTASAYRPDAQPSTA